MTIKEHDFRKIDLNLLIAFTVLFREQSVSWLRINCISGSLPSVVR